MMAPGFCLEVNYGIISSGNWPLITFSTGLQSAPGERCHISLLELEETSAHTHIATDICALIFLVLSHTCLGLYKFRFKISDFDCPGDGHCILSLHPFQCSAGRSGK